MLGVTRRRIVSRANRILVDQLTTTIVERPRNPRIIGSLREAPLSVDGTIKHILSALTSRLRIVSIAGSSISINTAIVIRIIQLDLAVKGLGTRSGHAGSMDLHSNLHRARGNEDRAQRGQHSLLLLSGRRIGKSRRRDTSARKTEGVDSLTVDVQNETSIRLHIGEEGKVTRVAGNIHSLTEVTRGRRHIREGAHLIPRNSSSRPVRSGLGLVGVLPCGIIIHN